MIRRSYCDDFVHLLFDTAITMSPQKSRAFWCLVEGDPMPYYVFDIPIGANLNVYQLRALIHERAIKLLHDTDARYLRLLKVISLIPRVCAF